MPFPISWRLTPGQHLLHRCWDGECALYNDLTGDTHLVDDFALALLLLLRDAPMPATLLAQSLLEASTPTPDAPADDPLQDVLADLAALNLIEAAPC